MANRSAGNNYLNICKVLLSKTRLFILLLLLVTMPFTGYRIWWLLNSVKTNGVMSYAGKSYTGQIPHDYSAIKFIAGNDTTWFNTSDNIIFKIGEIVPVRYRPHQLQDAKVDIFIEIWGDTVVYGGELALILIIIFVHPGIIPRRSKILLRRNKPFMQIV